MTRSEATIDALILVGDYHWRKGPFWPKVWAVLFGRREVFTTQFGDTVKVAWWRGQPFLTSISEAS